MKDSLALAADLVEGGGGDFEISVDGKLLFSKQSTQRFPDQGEVVRLIQHL